ncbi:MAG: hypothetical protein F4Z01_06295 [Gammaproteobacteria bacterium]|nr:hypothetical protein [Gammaproteobacteria bacterium]MYF37610.1 hypothetical protein [Gammaproteobacteria bacterium]
MRIKICIALVAMLTLVPVAQAKFTETVLEDGSIKDVVYELEIFESYGNKTKVFDHENMLIKFRHQYEDGTKTYKTYKVEVLEVSENKLEIHVKYQEEKGTDDRGWRSDDSKQEIDVNKAFEFWLNFSLPDSHSLSELKGYYNTHTINGLVKDEKSSGFAKTEDSTPIRFVVDVDTGEVVRIDFLSLSTTSDGLVYKMEMLVPDESIILKSMDSRAVRNLVEELLKANTPDTLQKPQPNESTDGPTPINRS